MVSRTEIFESYTKEEKLPHACFVETIANPIKQPYLKPSSFEINDPMADQLIMYTKPVSLSDLKISKSNAIVYQEKFTNMYGRNKEFTLDDLKKSVDKFVDNEDNYQYHIQKSKIPERIQFFRDKNLSESEAQACTLSLSFYTGSAKTGTGESDEINREASEEIREANGDALQVDPTNEKYQYILPIMYYICKALSNIPFYWGKVTRAVKLKDEEIGIYTEGKIITWIQFSSSIIGEEPPDYFAERNTYFFLYSLTGRHIKRFSNFQDEDEVLFAPYSCFLVLKKKYDSYEDKNYIYMRQVDIGSAEKTILWADDRILCPDWENKGHMEFASCLSGNNVHFIPCPSTNIAHSFLLSEFAEVLKNSPTFRIVTDMTRPDEKDGDEAGAIFLKIAFDLGFHNKAMIFTSNQAKAEEILLKYFSTIPNFIEITDLAQVARNFITFQI